jgi:hypothetical protein
MRTDRCFWIVLSILLCWAGVHILLGSIRHSGGYSDELILVGGTLSALGVVPLFVALEQHLQIRALARHMRLGSHLSRKLKTGRRANSPY